MRAYGKTLSQLELKNRAKELQGFNYTCAQIATQLGLSEVTVRNLVEENI